MWKALGRDDLLADENFCNPGLLTRNRAAATEAQAAILAGLGQMTTAQAVEALAEHSVPAGPVLTRAQVFDDPQVIHNNLIVEWDLPNGETLLQAGPPGTFSATQPEFRPFIGVVGEHTEQILAELGHDAATIASFRGAGVVA
jgi:crotonobetainyl-CoA:carnitine CoA-transferase CaiB-like acyl-CoA transferase